MPRGGGVARDVGFIDNKEREERCTLTRETGPCIWHIDNGKCKQKVKRDARGKIQWDGCTGNSPRERKKFVPRESLTAWAI